MVGESNGVVEIAMEEDTETGPEAGGAGGVGDITLGISIEPAATLAPQLAALAQQRDLHKPPLPPNNPPNNDIGALTLYNNGANRASRPSTKVLAQRIIKNAFNFLASFAAGGDDMVPLKSFEGWWRKFEGRVNADPGFLEREGEGD